MRLHFGLVLFALGPALLAAACGQGSSAPSSAANGSSEANGSAEANGSSVANGSSAAPSQVGARAPSTEAAEEGPLVVFLGDSITAGLHLDREEAFPAVLEEQLEADGHALRVVNAGVSGDTTAGGLSRIDWVLRQKPDLVVVELGGNDGLRGQSLASIEKNLRAIVARCRDAGARVLLLGMRLPSNYGPDYTSGFAAVYDRVAEDLDLDYVPYFMEGVGGVERFNLGDGLHPTAEGHAKLAEKIFPRLHDVLEELEQ